MAKCKCKHIWRYWDENDYPNGYEYEEVHIPHRCCIVCGREYVLFDGYGDYKNRWRRIK